MLAQPHEPNSVILPEYGLEFLMSLWAN